MSVASMVFGEAGQLLKHEAVADGEKLAANEGKKLAVDEGKQLAANEVQKAEQTVAADAASAVKKPSMLSRVTNFAGNMLGGGNNNGNGNPSLGSTLMGMAGSTAMGLFGDGGQNMIDTASNLANTGIMGAEAWGALKDYEKGGFNKKTVGDIAGIVAQGMGVSMLENLGIPAPVAVALGTIMDKAVQSLVEQYGSELTGVKDKTIGQVAGDQAAKLEADKTKTQGADKSPVPADKSVKDLDPKILAAATAAGATVAGAGITAAATGAGVNAASVTAPGTDKSAKTVAPQTPTKDAAATPPAAAKGGNWFGDALQKVGNGLEAVGGFIPEVGSVVILAGGALEATGQKVDGVDNATIAKTALINTAAAGADLIPVPGAGEAVEATRLVKLAATAVKAGKATLPDAAQLAAAAIPDSARGTGTDVAGGAPTAANATPRNVADTKGLALSS